MLLNFQATLDAANCLYAMQGGYGLEMHIASYSRIELFAVGWRHYNQSQRNSDGAPIIDWKAYLLATCRPFWQSHLTLLQLHS
jgi:hypothetical protein